MTGSRSQVWGMRAGGRAGVGRAMGELLRRPQGLRDQHWLQTRTDTRHLLAPTQLRSGGCARVWGRGRMGGARAKEILPRKHGVKN